MRRIDALEDMEKAARRLQEAAQDRLRKGGFRNRERAHMMLQGADELRREAQERRARGLRGPGG